MLVKNWMSKPAITAHVDTRPAEALDLLQRHDIHMLPVMDGGRLVGIVTDRDLQPVSASPILSPPSSGGLDSASPKAIHEIMTQSPVTILCTQTIEDTAELLLIHKLLGLPVVTRVGSLVGVITKSDIFRFIITIIGMGKEGIQLAVELVDRPGCIQEVTDIVRDYGGRVGSVFSSLERAALGYRQAYFRIYGSDRPGLMRVREILQDKLRLLYIIDHREKLSEIF
jgi:acetoin utilization protein AcuB